MKILLAKGVPRYARNDIHPGSLKLSLPLGVSLGKLAFYERLWSEPCKNY